VRFFCYWKRYKEFKFDLTVSVYIVL